MDAFFCANPVDETIFWGHFNVTFQTFYFRFSQPNKVSLAVHRTLLNEIHWNENLLNFESTWVCSIGGIDSCPTLQQHLSREDNKKCECQDLDIKKMRP